MLLSRDDADLFFRLHRSLMHRQAKVRQGIVTSLPIEAIPIPAAMSTELRNPTKSSKKTSRKLAPREY